MVTQVTTNDVTNILNNQTSKVAELKKKFTLGSFGYNLFKLISCFLSKSNPKKLEMIKAETMDKMPSEIKKTAVKIEKLLKGDKVGTSKVAPSLIKNHGNLLLKTTEYLDIQGTNDETAEATKSLQVLMETFTSQAQKLAAAYGHDTALTGVYVQALDKLINKKNLSESLANAINDRNFLPLSAIKSQTKAFAKKDIGAIATGLETFINQLSTAFPNIDKNFIITHVYKQLAEIDILKSINTYIENHSPQKAEELAKKENQSKTSQIETLVSECESFQKEIEELRGPNRMNGTVHYAWISYMKECCRYTLKANELTTSPDIKLKDEIVVQLKKCVDNPKELQDILKEKEHEINQILTQPGFAHMSTPLLILNQNNVTKYTEKLTSATAELENIAIDVDKAFTNYKTLDAKLKELSSMQGTEFQNKTVKVGKFEHTAIMNTNTEEAIKQLLTDMDTTATQIAENFNEKTKQATTLQKRIEITKDKANPSYVFGPETHYKFENFTNALNEIKE